MSNIKKLELNNFLISAVVLFGLSAFYAIFYLMIFALYSKNKLGNWLKSFISIPKEITIGTTTLKHTSSYYIGILFFTLFIVSIIMFGIGGDIAANAKEIKNDNVTVQNPPAQPDITGTETFENSDKSTYKTIGYGPVIDSIKIQEWLNGGVSGTISKDNISEWKDGNGNIIKIPTSQFKSLYGYIPPSFSYYPEGQTKNDYNTNNYKSGREKCMQACSLTNCTAVQTEVPENCSQEADPTGKQNSCGTNSEFSCTLFYDNISKADDAYWKIENYNYGGCINNSESSCMGKKYYEDIQIPTKLAENKLPSQANKKFCDPNVIKPDDNCIMRPIITTEYIQYSHPYYALPLDVTKASNVTQGDYSIVVPSITYKNGTSAECGIVGGSNNQSLVSCSQNGACGSNSQAISGNSDCFTINTSSCNGSIYDKNSGQSALDTYKNNYNSSVPNGSNYNDLTNSCYYKQQLTTVQPIQFNCDSTKVIRGCSGSPSILYTSSLSNPEKFAACSDTNIIPSSLRCQNRSDLASCTDFPYNCESLNGNNSLWVRQ